MSDSFNCNLIEDERVLSGLLIDPSVNKRPKKYRIDFCSYHKTICEDFKNYCATLIGEENTNTINNYGTAYHIRFNKQEIVRQLAIALYKDSKLSISRKQEMAEKIFYI